MLTIKEIPTSERPRERLQKNGVENLSDTEILSIILKNGNKKENVKTLATNLLKEFSPITKLKDITYAKLTSINGIGQAKACEILASLELGKRVFVNKQSTIKKERYNNSKKIYENNKELFVFKNQEYFYCLYLNNKKELLERKLLFMGTNNQSIVHPREIFKEAYLLSASSIVCMHNHPSGDITPSEEDIALTRSLIEIGRIQQIPIIDHIIFGNNKYYSFYDESNIMRKL